MAPTHFREEAVALEGLVIHETYEFRMMLKHPQRMKQNPNNPFRDCHSMVFQFKY